MNEVLQSDLKIGKGIANAIWRIRRKILQILLIKRLFQKMFMNPVEVKNPQETKSWAIRKRSF